MALKKIEVTDELLNTLGINKTPKELGELIEFYTKKGIECKDISFENIFLLNNIVDMSKKLKKESETQEKVKKVLKELLNDLINDI